MKDNTICITMDAAYAREHLHVLDYQFDGEMPEVLEDLSEYVSDALNDLTIPEGYVKAWVVYVRLRRFLEWGEYSGTYHKNKLDALAEFNKALIEINRDDSEIDAADLKEICVEERFAV